MMKKEMSARSFLVKTNQKAAKSAVAFIAAYKEYLETGEVSEVTRPIVRKYDAGLIQATPALEEIKNVVWSHIQAKELEDAKKKIEEGTKASVSSTKKFRAEVLDAKGDIQSDMNGDPMTKAFDMPQDAERWCCRRLFDGPSDWVGVVYHREEVWSEIDKDQAIWETLKRGPRPAMKRQHKMSGKLGNNMKAIQSRSHFSQG